MRDAAILLGVLAGHDPNDAATEACLTPGNCFRDYTPFLDKKALKGARIAVPPYPSSRAEMMEAAMEVLLEQGAYVETIPALAPQLGICVSYPPPAGCSTELLYGQKRDLNAYLANTPGAPVHSIEEVVAFNATYVPPMKYGQAIFEAAAQLDTSPGSADTLRFLADLAEDRARSRGALDAVYAEFDAILAAANFFAGTPAKAGYPSITVPGGFLPPQDPIENPFPSGINIQRPRVLGAAPHRSGVRVRAGDASPAAAGEHAAARGRRRRAEVSARRPGFALRATDPRARRDDRDPRHDPAVAPRADCPEVDLREVTAWATRRAGRASTARWVPCGEGVARSLILYNARHS